MIGREASASVPVQRESWKCRKKSIQLDIEGTGQLNCRPFGGSGNSGGPIPEILAGP